MEILNFKTKRIVVSVFVLVSSLCLVQDVGCLIGKINYGGRFLKPGVPFQSKGFTSEELQIYCYRGVPKHILHLWQSVSLSISLDPEDYSLYIGTSPADVVKEYQDHHSSWTFSLLNWRSNNIVLDPFNTSCIGIHTIHDYQVVINILRIDFWKVISLAFGIFLFFSAPRLSNNPLFYYICGITFGISTSFIILIYLMSKLFPRKPLMYGFMLGGWTVGLYLLQLVWENIRLIAVNYQTQAAAYITFMGLVSFVICYRFGPVTDPRSKNLIKWSLQCGGLCSIFFSSKFHEASVLIILIILSYYNFPHSWSSSLSKSWKSRFPPKTRLLSEDEYHEEGARETVKALEELRKHCSSPECKQWNTVLRLKHPLRFAQFVEGKSHLDDSEILEYESSSLLKQYPEETDDSDTDSETQTNN